jgi:hypothetical protein
MYSSAAVYFLGVSLALGSYWGLIPVVLSVLGLSGCSTKKSFSPKVCPVMQITVPRFAGI